MTKTTPETNVECFRRAHKPSPFFTAERAALVEAYLDANPKSNVMHGIYVALDEDRCGCNPCHRKEKK